MQIYGNFGGFAIQNVLFGLVLFHDPCINTGMSCWYFVNGLFHPYINVGRFRPVNR